MLKYWTVTLYCVLLCLLQFFSTNALTSKNVPQIERTVLDSEAATCPNAEDFAPCTCMKDNVFHDLTADCSAVQDVSELVQAFQIHFPTPQFAFIIFNQNKHLTTLPKGVFDRVNFFILELQHTNLQIIEEGVLSNQTIVQIINCENSHITDFPWLDLDKMDNLQTLWLDSNRYSSLPSFDPAVGIKSSSLSKFALGSHQLTNLPSFELGSLTSVVELEFWHSPLGSIPEGHFSNLENLQWLTLVSLGLTELKANTLTFSDTAAVNQIYLRNNNISTVQQGAIQFRPGMIVDLHNNALTVLEEVVWRPLLEQGGSMDVGVNPISCGCDLAWMIREYQDKVDGRCPDGTKYQDLDPSIFDDC
ncbi:unnamed protein product [Meganyctiphanes norvegica]|uniref:Oplophorus-luciferin 2-monooxygenase non-catalytic subunit n=1 Tax=Meganyctiphanes norvegica TaxID=48144 RepID=A0AAV2RCV0_MEGNR